MKNERVSLARGITVALNVLIAVRKIAGVQLLFGDILGVDRFGNFDGGYRLLHVFVNVGGNPVATDKGGKAHNHSHNHYYDFGQFVFHKILLMVVKNFFVTFGKPYARKRACMHAYTLNIIQDYEAYCKVFKRLFLFIFVFFAFF